MTATYLGVLPGSGGGDIGLDSSKVEAKFLVLASSFSQDAATIWQTSGLPAAFDSHPDNALMRVRDYKCERWYPNSLYWVVSVEYSTPDANNNNTNQENDNPVDDLATISIDYEEREVPVKFIKTGGPDDYPKASNGEFYSPVPNQQLSTPVLTFSQNYAYSADIITYLTSCINTINSASFLGFPTKTLRIVSIKPVTEVRTVGTSKTNYLKVNFVMKFKSETWDLIVMDQGSFYLDYTKAMGFQKQKFKTDDGHDLDHGLLNGAGGQLLLPNDPVFLSPKQIYDTTDFTTLGLPTSAGGYKFV